MKVSIQFENLIQYTTITASTVEEIAGSSHIPFLTSATALSLSILKCVESIKSNRNEWTIMVEQIHEILCTIAKLCSTSEIKGVLPTAVLYDIAKFSETLQKILTVLNGQQKMGKIKQLFKQFDNAGRLESCKQELYQAVKMFRVRAGGSTLSHIGQMKKDAKQQHDELMALLDAHPGLINSDCSSVTGTLSSSSNSSRSFSLLPASPKIFHGRALELQDVVNILIQESAHVAILGAGGMGKTSLATAALHNPQVEAKYSHRYFVPCHSSPTCPELVAIIADYIGLEKGSKMTRRIAHYFAHAPPSLLVLDNLETTWEPTSSHADVEEFLSLLTDVPHLGLMITLRGAERPSKVKWSRPFLAPLMPLSNVAALQTFIEVADEGHGEGSVEELLTLTGNLPLAVSLIASVAGSEGCAQALSRWKLESTEMLSEGYDHRSSLGISIMLSYTSSRMTPGAQELLSILSMLPDGLADADLVQAKLPITDILSCKTTLVRTSLAFIDQDQRLKVLVPIREHILHIHPPNNALKLKLREHLHKILDLWQQFRNLNVAHILPQISQNLGNFSTVLLDGIDPEGSDIVQNFKSILFLNKFYHRAQYTYSPLLLQISEQMLHWKDHTILGQYLIELLESSEYLPDLDINSHITLGNLYFESKDPLEQARWYRALGMYFYLAGADFATALKYYQRAHSLAENIGYPTIVGYHVLTSICTILIITGEPLSALKHAKELHRCAVHIGNIYGQVNSLHLQARCYIGLASYWQAQHLLQYSRNMLTACGQQGTGLDINILNHQAEIHLLKSEYLESRKLQVAVASSCQPTSYSVIMANLNIAFIDTTTGVDSKLIHQNLDNCQSQLKALYGFNAKQISLIADYTAAELCLRNGDHVMANSMLEKIVVSRDISPELALHALEKLADLSTEMNNIMTTLQWAGMLLGLALKCRDQLQIMQAFRSLGQIFYAEGEDETAISLFTVALDGFTFMDVHHWRADCMVQIADIMNSCGEVIKAVELWKTARPLFERSSQIKDVTWIDSKLAAVDSAVLFEYQKQLQRLAELNIPHNEVEEAEDEEAGTLD
ncbi:hypothetical protein C8J57DRAFT_1471260 [Mycena rebaudengoi]|nr:hypothetical protein C8J57DRAFT_1471260 [Mycena rebaudengoi]